MINPYLKEDRSGKEMNNPFWQGVSWQGSPVDDNAGRNQMPLQQNPGPAQSHRHVPNNERNNGGTGIDARRNASAGQPKNPYLNDDRSGKETNNPF
jgi:hypothetical protein